MKKFVLTLLCSIPVFTSLAQTSELSVQVSSGLFSYGGKSAATTSYLFINDTPPNYNVNTPFGTKSAFSYGLAFQGQRITKKHFIWGFKAGYDLQAASLGIDEYTAMSGSFPVKNGKSELRNHLIQLNPHFGYRIPIQKIKLDITAGFNLGFIRKSDNYVTYDDQNDFFDKKFENGKINTKTDFGPNAGLAVSYKRVSISADYTYGLINYQRMMVGGNPQIYSRYLRFGIAYRIF
jgi:hypothetical protein